MNDFQLEIQKSYTEEEPDTIDLRVYWAVIWREKLGIMGLVLAACLVAFLILQNMTPIYKATATMLIEAKEANVVSIEEVYGIDATQSEYFATQFEILNSRKLAEEVIREFELDKHPEFDPRQQQPLFDWRQYLPSTPDQETIDEARLWQSVVYQFQDNLTVEPIRNTQLVKISFESAYPELTFRVANDLGEAYIENHLESRLALTQKAADWLTQRLGGMRDDLQNAELELQAYRERENLVDLSGVVTLNAKELDEITQRLVAARNKSTELKSQHEAVGNADGPYDTRWETLPGVLRDQLSQRLKETEATAGQEVTELSQRYGPKHPKWIAAASKFEEAKQVYQRQVRKVVSGFEKAYRQAIADESELQQALNRSKGEVQDINRKRYELSQLEREVETNRQLYDLFFTRFKETNTSDFEAANARFVDRAVKPFYPVKPRKTLVLLLTAILAGMVGVMLAFLKDMLDNTVKAPAEVETKLKQPVIGVLPRVTRGKEISTPMSEAVLDNKERTFAEAVRTARTGVALSGIDNPVKLLVITSSVPGEGKTTTAMNLAFAFGQLESVVLIDADMRRPSVAENCGFTHATPGLSNIIAGTESVAECVHEYQGINVIPAGVVPPNPLELLSSKRFDKLLGELAGKFDRVIIDSAPTQVVSDSLVLSSHVDGVLYVVKSDETPTQVASEGLKRLMRVNSRVLGVILNQFDAGQAEKYGGYGKGYYEYYGYGAKNAY